MPRKGSPGWCWHGLTPLHACEPAKGRPPGCGVAARVPATTGSVVPHAPCVQGLFGFPVANR